MNSIKPVEDKMETIPQIIRGNSMKWGDRTAMCMKRFGIWQKFTWQEYYERVKYFALGLIILRPATG